MSHPHVPPKHGRGGASDLVPVRTHRVLVGVVIVIAVATLVGLIVLWPRDVPQVDPVADTAAAVVVSAEATGEVGVWQAPTVRITVELRSGPDRGQQVDLGEVPTDAFPRISVGDRLELEQVQMPGSTSQYYIRDFRRTPALGWLFALFAGAVLAASRWHGLRALAGLGVSLAVVVAFIVPAILSGTNPALVALVGAAAVMLVSLYLTHGVNPKTTVALVGTSAALVITIAVGTWFIDLVRISGLAGEAAVYAGFTVAGLDLRGIVLAGLIIAALGVLDDVTVSQASTVFALQVTDPTMTFRQLFARAMTVGRDHIASVVNTLFLAYTGASLALIVLFSATGLPPGDVLNTEVVAAELVKILVGSIGLIAAVPLTTALAAAVVGAAPAKEPAQAPTGGMCTDDDSAHTDEEQPPQTSERADGDDSGSADPPDR